MDRATCRICGVDRPTSEFARDNSKRAGYSKLCKECDREKGRAYYRRTTNPNPRPRRSPQPLESRQCERCDKTFRRRTSAGNDTGRFCSITCANRRDHPDTDGPEYVHVPCTHCGKTVTKRARDLDRYPPFCDKSCAMAHKRPAIQAARSAHALAKKLERAAAVVAQGMPPLLPAPHVVKRECWACGRTAPLADFVHHHCSRECKRRYQRERIAKTHGPRVLTAGPCAECGTPFVSTSSGAAYCSDGCHSRSTRRRHKQVRRARLRAHFVEPVDLATVAIRDNWTCHICKGPVSTADWSLDHLVPLSHGGAHSYTNTALAHHLCNSLRGDGVGGRGCPRRRLPPREARPHGFPSPA